MVIVLLISYHTVCCTFFSMIDTLVTVQTSSTTRCLFSRTSSTK